LVLFRPFLRERRQAAVAFCIKICLYRTRTRLGGVREGMV